jgi:outer membrane protein with beta-barrel domain
VWSKTLAKNYRYGILLVLLTLLSMRAFAQEINPRITFLGGASLLSGSRSFVVGPSVFATRFNNGIKIGIRGTVNLTEHWGAEGTYSFSSNGLQVTRVAPAAVQTFGDHVHQITGNALYFFTARDRTFRPFVTAGLGVSRYSPTSDAKMAAAEKFLDQPAVLTGTSSFNFNFGAGMESKPWDHFGVRLDLRDHVTAIPRFGLPEAATSPTAPFFPISGRAQDFEITTGLTYYFTGGK